MSFFQFPEKKIEPKPEVATPSKIKYSDMKKCVLKKESGETSIECQEIFKKANMED